MSHFAIFAVLLSLLAASPHARANEPEKISEEQAAGMRAAYGIQDAGESADARIYRFRDEGR